MTELVVAATALLILLLFDNHLLQYFLTFEPHWVLFYLFIYLFISKSKLKGGDCLTTAEGPRFESSDRQNQ